MPAIWASNTLAAFDLEEEVEILNDAAKARYFHYAPVLSKNCSCSPRTFLIVFIFFISYLTEIKSGSKAEIS